MLERKREATQLADVPLNTVIYQNSFHASEELADMLRPHIAKQGTTMVLALTNDSAEIAYNLAGILNTSWGVIVNDGYVPKTTFAQLQKSQIEDLSARLIELDAKDSLLCLKDRNIILVDDCIEQPAKIENIALLLRQVTQRKIIVTAPTAIDEAYRELTSSASKIDVTLLTHQKFPDLDQASACYEHIFASHQDICHLLNVLSNNSLNNRALNSYIKYMAYQRMYELFSAIKKNNKLTDMKALNADLLVIEKFLSGKEVQQLELSGKTRDDYDKMVKEKILHVLNDVEIDKLFQYQWFENLFAASKKPSPGFFSLSSTKRSKEYKLSPEEEVRGFKNALLLVTCFYMFNKRMDNSKMRGKTSWYLLRLLCVIELYNGQSIDHLAAAIKAIPYEGILTPLKDKFVKIVDRALEMRNNLKLLNVALTLDMQMQDIIQLFVGTITTTNPERIEKLFNAKGDSYMKQADAYAHQAMRDGDVKQFRENRSNKEFVDKLIEKNSTVVFKAVELNLLGETFDQRLKSLKYSLKLKQKDTAVFDKEIVVHSSTMKRP